MIPYDEHHVSISGHVGDEGGLGNLANGKTKVIMLCSLLECHETKTKVITVANQRKGKYHKEPIRTQRKYMLMASSAGKRE